MAVEITESIHSPAVRDGLSNQSVTRTFFVTGTDDADLAEQKAGAETAFIYTIDRGELDDDVDCIRDSFNVTPMGPTGWKIVATYKPAVGPNSTEGKTDQEILARTVSFDTTGKTAHIDQSRETVLTLTNEAVVGERPAPDFQGCIGVDKDNIAGVDIVVPSFKFSLQRQFKPSAITPAYIQTLRKITGTVNSGMFQGLAAGEVLFLGASGSIRTGDNFSITYSFVVEESMSDETIGPFTVNKEGHDYLWIRYEDVDDEEAKALAKRPAYGFVERVYKRTDFSELNI